MNLSWREIAEDRLFKKGLVFCAILHVILQVGFFLPRQLRREDLQRDLVVYYIAGKKASSGEELYRPWPGYGPHYQASGPSLEADRFLYPPPAAALFRPMGRMGFAVFAKLWYCILLAAFWVYAMALARLGFGRSGPREVLLAGLVMALMPGTYRGLSLGNIGPVVWALYGWGLVSQRARGALFAAAAAVKLHTVFPLIAAAWREGRRIVYSAGAVLLVSFLLVQLLVPDGMQSFLTWFAYTVPTVPAQGSFNHDNVSLTMAGLRLARFAGWDYQPGPLGLLPRSYLAVTGLLAPAATAWLARRCAPPLHYSLVLGAAILFAPMCWTHYLPMLLPTLILLLTNNGKMVDAPGRKK